MSRSPPLLDEARLSPNVTAPIHDQRSQFAFAVPAAQKPIWPF
jgi:hypothetical protein